MLDHKSSSSHLVSHPRQLPNLLIEISQNLKLTPAEAGTIPSIAITVAVAVSSECHGIISRDVKHTGCTEVGKHDCTMPHKPTPNHANLHLCTNCISYSA